MFDLIIRHGTIIDGGKNPRYEGDLAIQGDRIAAIGDLSQAEAQNTIDAGGKIVSPGFIDVHTHSDAHLLRTPHILSKTSQGFTTEFLLLDGLGYAPVNPLTIRDWIYYLRPLNGLTFQEYSGWKTVAEFMALLDGQTAQNVVAHIPYANVRTLACGFGARQPDDFQMLEIKQMIRQGMEQGAVGLSTGLDYVDEGWATTDELIQACEAMAPDGIYVTHVRYNWGTLAGVQEAVEIGRRAGVPVHISHLKGTSDAENEAILTYIDEVAVHEVDFSFDVYPYVPSSTMLQYLFPYEIYRDGPLAAVGKLKEPSVRAAMARQCETMPLDGIHIAWVATKANHQYQGYTLRAFSEAVNKAPADALADLLIEEGMAVLLVFNRGENKYVEPYLSHDKYMMGSDGILQDGVIHPRQYGSAPRLLGRYARDKQLFSLEQAVYKLSGFPAARFNLDQRGLLRQGYYADITIFDPDTIIDKATFADPHQLSVGITQVLVNGVPIILDGEPQLELASWPGRNLKSDWQLG